MIKKTFLFSLLLGLSFVATGCAVKQKVALEYQTETTAAAAQAYPKVNVVVNDERPYIKDGEKPASYIGTYRGGFGNPFNVNTKDHVALSTLVLGDLEKDLSALGFIGENGDKTLVVDIMKWKFDAYQNATFDYLLNVQVLDSTKNVLAKNDVVGDKIFIKGSFWTGGKGGVERDMPQLYSNIIKNIVRENSDVLTALKAGR